MAQVTELLLLDQLPAADSGLDTLCLRAARRAGIQDRVREQHTEETRLDLSQVFFELQPDEVVTRQRAPRANILQQLDINACQEVTDTAGAARQVRALCNKGELPASSRPPTAPPSPTCSPRCSVGRLTSTDS